MSSAERPRFDWYETDQFVVVNIYIKNMVPKSVSVEFKPRAVHFKHDSSGQELQLDLTGTISSSESNFRISPVKAEIKLRKVANFRWNKLETEQGDNLSAQISAPMVDIKSVSNLSGPSKDSKMRDWEQQIKEIEKEEEENGSVEGLFRKIYAGADEEVRRAMNKSFTESNGTVLSTNWSEVQKEKVEMKPPESSEFKKW